MDEERNALGRSSSRASVKRRLSLPIDLGASVLLPNRSGDYNDEPRDDDVINNDEAKMQGRSALGEAVLGKLGVRDRLHTDSELRIIKEHEEAQAAELGEEAIAREFDRSSVAAGEPARGAAQHVRRYLRSRHEPCVEDYFFTKNTMFRWAWDSFVFKLASFITITVSLHALLSLVLSVSFTILFFYMNIHTDMPLSILATAVFFPISIGIGFNFNRREALLKDVGMLRGILLNLYWGARDWPDYSKEQAIALAHLKESIAVLLVCVRQTMLHNTPPGGSSNVYTALDDLELSILEVNNSGGSFRNSSM